MTTVKNIYNTPFGWCNQQTSVKESKYEEKRKNALIVSGESISKKETIKISKNKIMRLYIVPGALTLSYKQVNQNSCIL